MNAKKLLSLTLGLALALTGMTADVNAGEREKLAGYELTSLDGEKQKLSEYHGEVVVVNFWASWCAPCRKELPLMNEWHAKWTERGARVVAISIDKEQRKARKFAEKEGLNLNVFHDGPDGLAKSLDLPSLPCTFLLDRDGKVLAVYKSSSDKDLAALHSKVESLLNRPQRAAAGPTAIDAVDDGGSR